MNAIVPAKPKALTRAPRAAKPTPSLLNFLTRAMADPNLDAAKLQILVAMQRDIVEREAETAFHQAMCACQAEMQPVLRDSQNTQTNSKYAKLEAIDAAIRPIYTRHGFCLSFNSEPTDGPHERMLCYVTRTGTAGTAGHTKTYSLDAPPDTSGPNGKPNKTPLHGLGSTVSYLRRYLTCMIFNVMLADDNDGDRQTRPSLDGIDELYARHARVDELYALLADCSLDPAARTHNERSFLAKMGLSEIRSLADAPIADFPRLKNALLTKKGILLQRAAAATTTHPTINGVAS